MPDKVWISEVIKFIDGGNQPDERLHFGVNKTKAAAELAVIDSFISHETFSKSDPIWEFLEKRDLQGLCQHMWDYEEKYPYAVEVTEFTIED